MLTFLSQPAQQQLVAAKQPFAGSAWSAALASYFRDTYKGYKNHSIKTLLANIEAGKQYPETGDDQDTQANSLCKVGEPGQGLHCLVCGAQQESSAWGWNGLD
jgi:hypothetical protein